MGKRVKDAGSVVCDSTRATEDAEFAPLSGVLDVELPAAAGVVGGLA
jgi:hypothetical protein